MKRIFDIFFSGTVLIVLAPLFFIIAVIIVFFQGGPILFKQERLGLRHLNFKIIKFCSMTNKTNLTGELLSDELRTTKLGRFLRTTSLD